MTSPDAIAVQTGLKCRNTSPIQLSYHKMSQQYSYGGSNQGGYGQQGGYGGGGGGYGAPPPGQNNYQQQNSGYGAPPPQQGQGYGAPPPPGGGGYGGAGGSVYGQRPQAYNQSTGPPPGADPQLWSWFTAVDHDRSGRISPHELQAALVNADNTAFDLDTVKMLMSIFDTDRSGEVTFNEFVGLFKYVQTWREVFQRFDQDRSGSIDAGELGNALRSFGYGLSPRLLHIVSQKYIASASSTQNHPPPTGGMGAQTGITFDRFVRACVVIKSLTEGFQKFDTQRTGWAQLNYDQFMELALSAP
ncbi:unnamed protein product [Sympodiomycopsis kandeliae]